MQYAHPLTSPSRPIVRIGRGALGCACPMRPVGAFELPVVAWKQVGVSIVVGVGLGYVLFAKR